MRGLIALLAPRLSSFTLEILIPALRQMHARGLGAEGRWYDEYAALGHRRLGHILDLDARANQPMVSGCGRYVIVFNGEIYNFRELRRDLAADGVSFRTTSDTEVLLALFAHEGERMLPELFGMFAFAIWDRQTREPFLARDPYGIKPLYYTQTQPGLVVASQVKALLAAGLVSTKQERAGLAGFYLWGSVPMAQWLSAATGQTKWSGIPLLAPLERLGLGAGQRPL